MTCSTWQKGADMRRHFLCLLGVGIVLILRMTLTTAVAQERWY